jgi:hypothetical protein
VKTLISLWQAGIFQTILIFDEAEDLSADLRETG